jgi:hypothetical protein
MRSTAGLRAYSKAGFSDSARAGPNGVMRTADDLRAARGMHCNHLLSPLPGAWPWGNHLWPLRSKVHFDLAADQHGSLKLLLATWPSYVLPGMSRQLALADCEAVVIARVAKANITLRIFTHLLSFRLSCVGR